MIDALRAFGLDDLDDQVTVTRTGSVEYRNAGNGFHKTVTLRCFGCGNDFEAVPQQIKARRPWCLDCRKAGKPAAQRARDFRASRSKIQP
jgi:hypothetical protein